MKLPSVFERYRSEIDVELRSALAGRQLPIYDMLRYHLGWADEHGHPLSNSAGKALRPTLCLLACEAVREDYHLALPAAAAIELVHNFSLIHDDIQDNDRERRHRPTVWSIWGKPQAINAGTAMRVLASLALLRLGEHRIPLPKQVQVQRLIDESCLAMIEGQYLDIEYETRFDIGVADYLEMVDKKTAALIACSLEVGALLGSDGQPVVEGLRSFGRNLGLAFQIRDDVLGIWGDEQKTGKPLASDIRRRKKSLPVVYAVEKAPGGTKRELASIYGKQFVDHSDVSHVLTILQELGAHEYAQRMAKEFCCAALEEIEKVALSPSARRELEDIARFLVERDF